MKKIILSILLLLGAALGAQAQKNPYLGEVDLGFAHSPFSNSWSALSIHTVHGARIGDHFSVGGGLGLEGVIGGEDAVGAGLCIPLYLNLKGYLDASKPTTAYLTLDVGVIPHFGSDDSNASLYLCPAVGIKVRRFKADIGYKLIDKYGAFQLRLGVFLGPGAKVKAR